MDRMNLQRLAWMGQRAWLRHGPVLVVAVAVALAAVAMLLGIVRSQYRVAGVDREIAMQLQQARSRPVVGMARAKTRVLPLPPLSSRFGITRNVLDALEGAGFEPERIRFKFETIQDAGLTRQVVAFTLEAPWERIAGLLATLQASERSLYISRLRLARETPDDVQVTAEIQLAVALVGGATPAEAAP